MTSSRRCAAGGGSVAGEPRCAGATGYAPIEGVDGAIDRATVALLARQYPKGYWVGELQGDSILESEYILMKFILTQDDDPQLPKIANYLRSLQQPHGGWSLYPGGPADLSATAKGYFALKLLGEATDAPHMQAARKLVLQLGGAELLQQLFTFLPRRRWGRSATTPARPSRRRSCCCRKGFISTCIPSRAWTRTMILPLAITSALRPVRKLPASMGIAELFLHGPPTGVSNGDAPTGRRAMAADLSWPRPGAEDLPEVPAQAAAQEGAERSREMAAGAHEGFRGPRRDLPADGLHPHHASHARLRRRAIRSSSRPTSICAICSSKKGIRSAFSLAYRRSGTPASRCTRWRNRALHARRRAGRRRATSGCWKKNAGSRATGSSTARTSSRPAGISSSPIPGTPTPTTRRWSAWPSAASVVSPPRPPSAAAIPWLLAMQNEDGGWAAFDRTRDRPILEHIPFADHNAMQDPSCPDITGRVLESLGHCGFTIAHPAVRQAIEFIRSKQETEGCWWGRWGVNFVYGTWQVLTGLQAVGESMGQVYTRKAAAWLRRCQKPDGSWGESCETYDNPALKGQGESTPSQTAWGMMGLLAAGGPDDPAVAAAAKWLIDHQRDDGNLG